MNQTANAPGPFLRTFAFIGVVSLTGVWLFPLSFVLVFSGHSTEPSSPLRPPLSSDEAIAIIVVALLHALFLTVVFGARVTINFFASQPRSPLRWTIGAWALTVFSQPLALGILVPPRGVELGFAAWVAMGMFLGATGFSIFLGRVLWSWAAQSNTAALLVSGASLFLVWLPGIGVFAARSLVLGSHPDTQTRTFPATPSVRNLSGGSGFDDGSGSENDDGAAGLAESFEPDSCLAALQGPACNSVWQRAHARFDDEDELQESYLDVCLVRRLRPDLVCRAFWTKASQLHIQHWRYSRRFKDADPSVEPSCPLPSREEEAMTQEELDQLDWAQSALDTRERLLIRLKYNDGLTDEEIGARLGLTKGTVNKSRRRALQKLRIIMELRCPR